MQEIEAKNLAHDKAFAALYTLDTDISRLKQEIKDDNTPFYNNRSTTRRVRSY